MYDFDEEISQLYNLMMKLLKCRISFVEISQITNFLWETSQIYSF